MKDQLNWPSEYIEDEKSIWYKDIPKIMFSFADEAIILLIIIYLGYKILA